jgi:hypothetical protein
VLYFIPLYVSYVFLSVSLFCPFIRPVSKLIYSTTGGTPIILQKERCRTPGTWDPICGLSLKMLPVLKTFHYLS